MNTELCFGQRYDHENGLVELWLTHGALDWIKQQDWSNKNVLMFGSGMGDLWLDKRCKELVIVERNEEWMKRGIAEGMANRWKGSYVLKLCNDCSGQSEYYIDLDDYTIPFDVIINDDAYRYEVCVEAEKYFKQRGGGILITDNWQQSYVFMCPAASELLDKYESKIFEQADHLDNDGVNKWKTAIHFIK